MVIPWGGIFVAFVLTTIALFLLRNKEIIFNLFYYFFFFSAELAHRDDSTKFNYGISELG